MKKLTYFPLFSIILILYNILAFWGTGGGETALTANLFTITLVSGGHCQLTVGSLLIIIGLHILYFNILKSVRSTLASMVSQALAVTVFIVFIIEFIVVERAGTPQFLILMVMSMLDVIGGFTISISNARRDVAITHD